VRKDKQIKRTELVVKSEKNGGLFKIMLASWFKGGKKEHVKRETKDLKKGLLEIKKVVKELDIKILGVRQEITDTNRDRFKTYKIKLQHKKFGYTKPYTVSFHVPIPSKGKYLKIGGNDYIMINQFFSKPIVKVSPKMIRLYTHFSTLAVHLKQHIINTDDNIDEMYKRLGNAVKGPNSTKKINIKHLSDEEISDIKEKWNLPKSINNKIFVKMEA